MNAITIIHKTEDVTICTEDTVIVQKQNNVIALSGDVIAMIPFVFVPFFFTATDGQTDFTLASTPMTNGVIVAAINGVYQSQAKGDFTIAGAVITLSDGLDSGDVFTGIYAKTI